MKHFFDRKKLIALIGAVAIFFSACAMKKKSEGDSVVVLNQRQIDILSEQGLPTDYEQLTMTQKGAITAIERFLSYLESKHSDEFIFAGYWPTGPEHIKAKCSKGVVTAYRTYKDGEYNYWDSYDNLLREVEVSAVIDSYYQAQNEQEPLKWYSEFSSEISSNADNKVVYAQLVAFSADTDSDAVIKRAEAFGQWLKDQNLFVQMDAAFYGVSKEDLNEIEDYNYQDFLDSRHDTVFAGCYVSEHGSISIYERGA